MFSEHSNTGWFLRLFAPQIRFHFMWEAIAAPVVGGVVNKLMGNSRASDAEAASAELSRSQAQIGLANLDRNRKVFWPLQDKLVDEVKDAGGLADQERAAGQAGDEVARAGADATGALTRNLQQFGVNPTDGRYADSFAKLGLNTLVQDAASRNTARIGARELGFNKKMQVSGLGNGLDSAGLSAVSNASANLGNLANAGYTRARQQAADVGYALQPAVKAGTEWLGGLFKGGSSGETGIGLQATSGSGGWSNPDAGVASLKMPWQSRAGFAEGGLVDAKAGGSVSGPGTDVSDSIPANLSDGEFVVNAPALKMLGKEMRQVLEAANLVGTVKRAVKERSAGLADARRAA